eukprot:3007726-Pleurochrysis_carterae.AAC.1
MDAALGRRCRVHAKEPRTPRLVWQAANRGVNISNALVLSSQKCTGWPVTAALICLAVSMSQNGLVTAAALLRVHADEAPHCP